MPGPNESSVWRSTRRVASWPRPSLVIRGPRIVVHEPVKATSRVPLVPRALRSVRPPLLNASTASSVLVPAARTIREWR